MTRPKRSHPAARTRAGLVLGSVIATMGLTGSYWAADRLSDDQSAATATTTVSDDGSSATDSTTESDSAVVTNSTNDTSSDATSGGAVQFSPSSGTPDSSSHAS
ncbi:MAG TPA: hypothetical protein VFF40_13545 [Acidimicrobiia bacterium]|nr:hypothetical protein [Acidimicrobiia bacterium]